MNLKHIAILSSDSLCNENLLEKEQTAAEKFLHL